MQIAGTAQFTENGTFEKTEDLLKSKTPPQTAMMNQIINNTLQKQTEQASIFRSSVNHALGVGIMVDTQA